MPVEVYGTGPELRSATTSRRTGSLKKRREGPDRQRTVHERNPMGSSRLSLQAFFIIVLTPVSAMVLLAPGAANAADAYKYWGYYNASGSNWEYSSKGAEQYVPKDGSVEGWRYGLDLKGTRFPRAIPDFDLICADAAPGDGEKAVAIILDYGTADEAENGDVPPEARGECVEAAADATGLQLLQQVADVRVDKFIVAIDGYPSQPPKATYPDVTIPTDEPAVQLALAADDIAVNDEPSDKGFPWAVVGLGGVVLLLAGAAFAMSRRGG